MRTKRRAVVAPAYGLSGMGAPVSRWTRSTLPPSESRLRGLVPTAASPVPIRRAGPVRSRRSRQPPCRPVVAGNPPIRVRRCESLRHDASTCHLLTRTSLPPAVLAPWQAHSTRRRRSTAIDIRPVSPATRTSEDRSARVRRVPLRTTLSRARSRSVTSRRPPGASWTSQDCSSPRSTVRTWRRGADADAFDRSGAGALTAWPIGVMARAVTRVRVVLRRWPTSTTLAAGGAVGNGTISRVGGPASPGCRSSWWRSPGAC